MTLAYFDSSALVKLVIDEPGSDDAAALWDGADAVLTSRVAHPEVRAALAAAHRDQRLSRRGHRTAQRSWDELRPALRYVEVTSALAEHAGDLTEEHALSGFDAIHLASVLALGEVPVVVATWDARLLEATRACGFGTVPAGR